MKTELSSGYLWYGLYLVVMFVMMSNGCSEVAKRKILIVTGGHGFERDAFFEAFDSLENIEYKEVVQPAANDVYGSSDIDNYDALIFYDMVQEIDEQQKQDLLTLLDRGKGMVFLHHSLVSYQDWPEFEKIIGGRYYLKSENSDVTPSTYKHDVKLPVQVVDGKHPVTRGVDNFVIHDEAYGGTSMISGVQALLTTTHEENGENIAWAHQYKNSRIVYLQLGHDHFAFEDTNFRQLLKQAIVWVQNN